MVFGTIGLYIQDILEITTIPIFHHIIRQHFEKDSERMSSNCANDILFQTDLPIFFFEKFETSGLLNG